MSNETSNETETFEEEYLEELEDEKYFVPESLEKEYLTKLSNEKIEYLDISVVECKYNINEYNMMKKLLGTNFLGIKMGGMDLYDFGNPDSGYDLENLQLVISQLRDEGKQIEVFFACFH